jgi:hypothetical protein
VRLPPPNEPLLNELPLFQLLLEFEPPQLEPLSLLKLPLRFQPELEPLLLKPLFHALPELLELLFHCDLVVVTDPLFLQPRW